MPRVRVANKETPVSKQGCQMTASKEDSSNQTWSPNEILAFHANVQLIGPEFHELSRRIGSKSYNQVRYFFYRIIKKAKSDFHARGIPVDFSNKAEMRYAVDYYFENLHSTKRRGKVTGAKMTTYPQSESSGNAMPGMPQMSFAQCAQTNVPQTFDSPSANHFRTTDYQTAHTIDNTFTCNQTFSKPMTPSLLDHDDIIYSTDVFGSSNNDIIDSSPSCPSWSSGTSPVASLDEVLGHGAYPTMPLTDAVSDDFLIGTSDFHLPTADDCVGDQNTFQYQACGNLEQFKSQDYRMESNPTRRVTLQLLPLCDAVADVMNAYGYNPKLQIKMRGTKQISSVLKHLRSKWSRLFEEDVKLENSIKLCFVQGEDTVSVFDNISVDLLSRQLFNGGDVVVLGYMWDMSQCQIEYLRRIQDETHCLKEDYPLISANDNANAPLSDAPLNSDSALGSAPTTTFIEEPGFSLQSFPNTSFGAANDWPGFLSFFPN